MPFDGPRSGSEINSACYPQLRVIYYPRFEIIVTHIWRAYLCSRDGAPARKLAQRFGSSAGQSCYHFARLQADPGLNAM